MTYQESIAKAFAGDIQKAVGTDKQPVPKGNSATNKRLSRLARYADRAGVNRNG